MKNKEKISLKEIIVALLFIAILTGIGFLSGYKIAKRDVPKMEKTEKQANSLSKEIRQSGYEFINPLLECEVNGSEMVYSSFEKELKNKEIEMMREKYPDIQYSLYFRNLQNGPWFGINEDNDFSPASLLKVPIMMAYYKNAETKPEVLEQKIVYKDFGFNEEMVYKPEKTGENGKTYTIQELIEFMIIGSDNNALNLVFQYMNKDEFNNIFKDLGIPEPDIYNYNDVITVKNYAAFFRILYNSSYLSRDKSEKALKLLSQVEYQDALRSTVPENVKVAHKFGERTNPNEKFSRQLHDCGIVYYEGYNYLICIMTRGEDFTELSKAIADMGKIVYTEIDQAMKNQK